MNMREKEAVQYLVRLGIQKLLGLLFYLIGTGFILSLKSGVYFALYILGTMVSGFIIYRADTEVLAERGKVSTDSPKWDKILLTLLWLLNYFIIYLVAGLGERKSGGIGIMFILGMVICIAAALITVRTMLVNTYLESTARVQKDRGQTVCQQGPYSIIRHPTYSCLLLNCLGLIIIFPSIGVLLCTLIIAVITVVRTCFEDSMLKNGLEGYKEYAKNVPYRLIPFIW